MPSEPIGIRPYSRNGMYTNPKTSWHYDIVVGGWKANMTDMAAALGLAPPAHFLDDNNAHAFFLALGDLINTGPSGTNVGDLQIVLVP